MKYKNEIKRILQLLMENNASTSSCYHWPNSYHECFLKALLNGVNDVRRN